MRSFLAVFVLLVGLMSVQGASARSRWPVAAVALSHEVARVYRGSHVRIRHVQSTRTDSSPNKPMYFITLTGTFHKGNRVARVLDFSALANRTYIWGIVAYDGHHHIVWTDPMLPRKK